MSAAEPIRQPRLESTGQLNRKRPRMHRRAGSLRRTGPCDQSSLEQSSSNHDALVLFAPPGHGHGRQPLDPPTCPGNPAQRPTSSTSSPAVGSPRSVPGATASPHKPEPERFVESTCQSPFFAERDWWGQTGTHTYTSCFGYAAYPVKDNGYGWSRTSTLPILTIGNGRPGAAVWLGRDSSDGIQANSARRGWSARGSACLLRARGRGGHRSRSVRCAGYRS